MSSRCARPATRSTGKGRTIESWVGSLQRPAEPTRSPSSPSGMVCHCRRLTGSGNTRSSGEPGLVHLAQRFGQKAKWALGFLVPPTKEVSHQFASFLVAFHPDVSQACPKTMDSELPADSTEIETCRNQRQPEIVRSLDWLTDMHR